MKILELTDADIEKIVISDVEMLKSGKFPDLRLENDGPDWDDASFLKMRSANIQWWTSNAPDVADPICTK